MKLTRFTYNSYGKTNHSYLIKSSECVIGALSPISWPDRPSFAQVLHENVCLAAFIRWLVGHTFIAFTNEWIVYRLPHFAPLGIWLRIGCVCDENEHTHTHRSCEALCAPDFRVDGRHLVDRAQHGSSSIHFSHNEIESFCPFSCSVTQSTRQRSVGFTSCGRCQPSDTIYHHR